MKDCQFGVSPVNYSDSDSDSDQLSATVGRLKDLSGYCMTGGQAQKQLYNEGLDGGPKNH